MRRAFQILVAASACTWFAVPSCYGQKYLPYGEYKNLPEGLFARRYSSSNLTVDELASILGVTTWRVQLTLPAGHDLAAGLVFLPAGSVYEPSKLNLYGERLGIVSRVVGHRQVLFVVRQRDDGHVQMTVLTAQEGSSSREFSPPRLPGVSITYPVEKIERLAGNKHVLMRFDGEDGSPVAAFAYWFEPAESSSP